MSLQSYLFCQFQSIHIFEHASIHPFRYCYRLGMDHPYRYWWMCHTAPPQHRCTPEFASLALFFSVIKLLKMNYDDQPTCVRVCELVSACVIQRYLLSIHFSTLCLRYLFRFRLVIFQVVISLTLPCFTS